MNIIRILLFVAIIILIIMMARNIEEVKTIANPCTMCTEKTGAVCMIRNDRVNLDGFDINNITLYLEE